MAVKIDIEKLQKMLEPVTEALGYELAKLSAPVIGGRLTLRVYIHSQNGVMLDACARISRAISDKLDTDDPIAARYTLEVSSLGLDSPLVTPRDFERRVGERVEITYDNGGKKKVATGILKESIGEVIRLGNGDETSEIPIEANPRGKILI